METRVTEVAEGIHQLSTFVGAPVGFNQYLIAADEPLLFHTGLRHMFPLVSAGVSKVLPAETLRWVSFGHVEADESGAMNDWLALAPHATVAQSQIGCMVSIGDLADRPPRPLADGEKLDIGGHIVQWFDTPHVPHAWEPGEVHARQQDRCPRGWAGVGRPAGRVRDLPGRSRHRTAARGPARRCLPVPALGLRVQGQLRDPLRRPRRDRPRRRRLLRGALATSRCSSRTPRCSSSAPPSSFARYSRSSTPMRRASTSSSGRNDEAAAEPASAASPADS